MLSFLKNIVESDSGDRSEPPPISRAEAVCAVLLETARSDESIDREERAHIVRTLQNHFQLAPEEADELIRIVTAKRESSIDLFPFTRRINESFDREEKWNLLVEIWHVIFADGRIEAHEDQIVHRISRLLNMRHSELIEAKLTARDESRG